LLRFRLYFLRILLDFSLWLDLLRFLLNNILKPMTRSQLSTRKASTSALAGCQISPGHLTKQS
jgi:hypothetical protein